MTIRSFERSDYDQWHVLWNKNCSYQISDDVTAETWRRLCHPKELVFGLAAFKGEEMIGFLHYVLHATTGYIQPACYMQDLYVAEYHRRQGIAKRLVWTLHDQAKNEKWARLYWFSDNTDSIVKNLYKNLGIHMDFS